jgi:hypothetical protein
VGAAGSGMFGNKRNRVISGIGVTLLLPTFAAIATNALDINADRMFFCSELVSRAFTVGGFPIIDGKATYATPQMVFTSRVLSYVGHLINTPEPSKTGSNLTEKEKERNRRAGYRKDYQ